MKKLHLNKLSAAILAALTASSSNYVLAEGDALLALEEIVVTAERRSQTLQEIPLAVSAVSGNKIERSQITRTDDLSAAAPGLQISSGRLGEQKLVIRGVGGSVRDNIAASPKVALFVDDVYVSRGAAMDMAFFDLDRIEILRGPQGTLYGKNAIAGALNVYSKAPTDEFESKISATAGNYDQRQTRFMVSGPLAENLYGKVLGGSNERDGYTDNLTTGSELSVEESYFGRASLVFEGEQWDLRAIMDYEHNPSNPGTALHIVGSTGFDPLNVGGALGTVSSPDDRYEVTLDEDGEGSQTNQGFSFKASYTGEAFAFDSITGYRDIKNSFIRDIDNSDSTQDFFVSPLVFGDAYDPMTDPDLFSTISIINRAEDDSWSVSQEFRISSADGGAFTLDGDLFWTAGLYLFHDEGEREEEFHIVMPGIAYDQTQVQTMEIEGDTIALYGQATYTVNDDLDLIFGLRYSYETKEVIHSLVNGHDGFGLVDEAAFTNIKADESWTQVSPKITANYQISEDLMAFATYSKGSLGGGFNFGPASAAEAASDSFDQEDANNFEIGIKGSALDNRLQYTLSAFYIDYSDLQVQGVNSTGATTTTNAANATSQGVELELTALVTEGLTLSANYAYVDATFDEYCQEANTDNSLSGAACIADGGIDNKGNQLEYSSEHVFNLSAEYIMSLQDKGDLIFNTSYNYVSDQYFGPDNTAGQEAFDLVAASVAFESADGHWYLSLWGKNLTDEEHNVDFVDYGKTSDAAAYVQGDPRTYGATVTWTY
jgi:iron complex outermembrane recepter protein